MRSISPPFVVIPPAGATIHTRLRLTPADEQVVAAVGGYLGTLANQDLAWRTRLGLGPDRHTDRKRILTAASSSRWAGALTRTSNDQWQQGYRNLLNARTSMRRAIRVLDRRLQVPVGGRQGRVRGYLSQAERHQKQRRLQLLTARLAKVERRLTDGKVSICRGGRRLAKLRHHLDDAAGLPASE
jgi:hypothetical protein